MYLLNKIRRKKKQKSAAFLNEKAFTLIEVLLALSILLVLMYFVTPIFKVILTYKDTDAELQTMEWEVFSSQLKKEVRQSTKGEIISGSLLLTKDNESITYEKYGTVIRRRVNTSGNEIVLQNVSQYNIKIENNAVKLTVKDFLEKEYSLTAYFLVSGNSSS